MARIGRFATFAPAATPQRHAQFLLPGDLPMVAMHPAYAPVPLAQPVAPPVPDAPPAAPTPAAVAAAAAAAPAARGARGGEPCTRRRPVGDRALAVADDLRQAVRRHPRRRRPASIPPAARTLHRRATARQPVPRQASRRPARAPRAARDEAD